MNRISRILTGFALLGALAFLGLGQYALAVLWLAISFMAFARPAAGCGANALGELAGDLILRTALELVFTKRPMLRNISTGFRDLDSQAVTANFNQKVVTRVRTVATVNNFGSGAVDTAFTDISVTLSLFKEVHYAFTPQQYSATARDLVEETAEPLAVAIANNIVDTVAALWTPANYPGGTALFQPGAGPAPTPTIVGAGWSYTNTLIPIRNVMSKRGVPDWGWFFACNSDVYGSLLTDALVVAALNNPDNQHAIMQGRLPKVANMGIEEYPSLPNNGVNVIGFAGSPDSVVYAARVPKDPREVLPNAPFPGNLGVITEPKTGFSVMVTQWIDPATLICNNRLVWMAGFAVGNPNNGQVLTSA